MMGGVLHMIVMIGSVVHMIVMMGSVMHMPWLVVATMHMHVTRQTVMKMDRAIEDDCGIWHRAGQGGGLGCADESSLLHKRQSRQQH